MVGRFALWQSEIVRCVRQLLRAQLLITERSFSTVQLLSGNPHLPCQQNTEFTQYGNLIRPVTRPRWGRPMDAAVKRIAPQAQCYQRRRPEKTLWYRTVQTHFETRLAHSTWQGDESTLPAPTATSAVTTSSSPSRVKGAACAPPVTHGAWPRPPHI